MSNGVSKFRVKSEGLGVIQFRNDIQQLREFPDPCHDTLSAPSFKLPQSSCMQLWEWTIRRV